MNDYGLNTVEEVVEMYSYEDVIIKINDLLNEANDCIMQKGNKIPVTYELLYFMAVVDKSIKMIDCFLYALKTRNITVLAVLTRVQMDCVFRAYALKLVEDHNTLTENIIMGKEQLNRIKGKDDKMLTDKYLAEKIGEQFNLLVYELYQKVCGFVHFSNKSFHTMVDAVDESGFSMLLFSKGNPLGKEREYERVSLELANQFYCFGNILINNLFDSWIKQCLETDN